MGSLSLSNCHQSFLIQILSLIFLNTQRMGKNLWGRGHILSYRAMKLRFGCPRWFIPGVPLGLLTWLSVAWPLLCVVSYPAISSQTLPSTVSFPCHQMSGYPLLHANEGKRGQMKRNYRKTGASFPACNTMRQTDPPTSIVSSEVRTAAGRN